MSAPPVQAYVASAPKSALAAWADRPAWLVTQIAETVVADLIAAASDGYVVQGGVGVHMSATVEPGANIKAPALIGPRCFVASTALLRGGVWLEADCIIGPSAELKTSFLFAGSKLAHLNFVGDSVIGAGVNIEAGAMIANYRNERDDKRIRIRVRDGMIGALIGDGARIGANAVIAPGALIAPRAIVARLQLIDQG